MSRYSATSCPVSTNTRSPVSNRTAQRRAGSAKWLAAQIHGVGLHFTKVLDDDTSAFGVGVWIDLHARIHRQLTIGFAAAPDAFEHRPTPDTTCSSPLPVHHRRPMVTQDTRRTIKCVDGSRQRTAAWQSRKAPRPRHEVETATVMP